MDAYKPATSGLKVIATFVVAAYAMSVALSLIVGLTGGFQSTFIGLQFLSTFLGAFLLVC